mgnify:FL=1
MVVVGYTTRGYVVNSGLSEHQFVDRETFRSLWEGNDRYYLRVTPVDVPAETGIHKGETTGRAGSPNGSKTKLTLTALPENGIN